MSPLEIGPQDRQRRADADQQDRGERMFERFREIVEAAVELAADAALTFVKDGLNVAMNRFNKRGADPKRAPSGEAPPAAPGPEAT